MLRPRLRPYGDAEEVLDSFEMLAPEHHVATISVKRLAVKFYCESTAPNLVRMVSSVCLHWSGFNSRP